MLKCLNLLQNITIVFAMEIVTVQKFSPLCKLDGRAICFACINFLIGAKLSQDLLDRCSLYSAQRLSIMDCNIIIMIQKYSGQYFTRSCANLIKIGPVTP